MSDPTTPALRAANADREQTVAVLREHAVEGRLSLEEFTDRMSSAYLAGTKDQLDELLSDLPSGTVPVSRRPSGNTTVTSSPRRLCAVVSTEPAAITTPDPRPRSLLAHLR